jgi:O-antigen/teichoic acid export membrane protein
MRKHIEKLLNKDDGLLRAGMIFLFGSVFTALANYLYQIYMGRTLGPEQYGVLGSLFAIIYIVQISAGTVTTVVSHYTSTYYARKDYGRIKALVQSSFKYISFISVVALAIFILLTPAIASFLHLDSHTGLVLVGILGFISLLTGTLTGCLNGLQRFLYQNILGVLSAGIKLGLGILFVMLGYGVAGALGGMICAGVIAFIVGLFSLLKLRHAKPRKIRHMDVIKYALPVLITVVIPAFLITIDILLVKHFFSANDAGLYTAANVIAKIIWFVSGFLVGAMFPKVVYLHASKKETLHVFKSALLYTALIVAGVSLTYFLFPSFIVKLFYGSAYNISSLIGFYGLAFGFFALNQLLIMYNLALKQYRFIYYVIGAIVAEVVLIYFLHTSLLMVVFEVLGVLAVLFGLLFFETLGKNNKAYK